MSGEYPRGFVELFEDFTRDNVTSLNQGSSGGSQDITDKHGGWFGLTTASGATDYAWISGELSWEVDEGHPLIFETRLAVSSTTDFNVSVGFTDDTAEANAIIFTDEAGALVSECADGFAFMVEGDQDLTWQAVAVDTNVDETQVALTLGADIVASTIQTLRMEANPNNSGTVKYFIDGELVSTQTGWFDSGIVFAPGLSSDDRGTSSNVDYDYLYVSAPRS
ncbi:hypothetical protein LCGC14_1862430 [marine sediment metagenome]|uniref:Uncharacterized protein n=1 Tax=marine sediment metagenome TaxID=412755 RepID=A0A0F9J626_9ZZZZ